jgi:hypothetical protein
MYQDDIPRRSTETLNQTLRESKLCPVIYGRHGGGIPENPHREGPVTADTDGTNRDLVLISTEINCAHIITALEDFLEEERIQK